MDDLTRRRGSSDYLATGDSSALREFRDPDSGWDFALAFGRRTAERSQVVRLRATTGIGRVVFFWYASYRLPLLSLTSFHRRA
jgi:hypothetical protein